MRNVGPNRDRLWWPQVLACAGITAALNWETSRVAVAGVSLHPGQAAVVFAGAVFGPAAGFVAGALGGALVDLLVGSFWWNWTLGNGLVGLVAGVFCLRRGAPPTAWRLVAVSLVAHLAGMLLSCAADVWMGATWAAAVGLWAVPAALANGLMGSLATPFVFLAWRVRHELAVATGDW